MAVPEEPLVSPQYGTGLQVHKCVKVLELPATKSYTVFESVLTETRASQGTRQSLRVSIQNLTLPDSQISTKLKLNDQG